MGLRLAVVQYDVVNYVLIRRGKFGQRQTQKMPCYCGGRDYSYAATNQQVPGATRSWMRKKRGSKESMVLPTPQFHISNLQNSERQIFVPLRHPGYGTLL